MDGNIDIKNLLAIIDSGEWFYNLFFITANVNKGSGGRYVEIPKARIARNRNAAITSISTQKKYDQLGSKNPNQHLNFTRNIELPNKNIISIHPIIVTHINNKTLV
jgi:hypothetical protein